MSVSFPKLLGNLVLVACAIGLWLAFAHRPPVHDVAWLLEATGRWIRSEGLYVDIREINPPLIFYDFFWLSAGTAKNGVFVAGVAASTLATSWWVSKHYGLLLGLGVFVSISFAGLIEFGQREHLLLIFVVPYLLARGGRAERIALGLWAFLGIGLKPHYILVVLLPALVEARQNRSSLLAPEKLSLAASCVAYPLLTWLFYPSYFEEIVPMGAATYFATGVSVPPLILIQSAVIVVAILLADKEKRPFAAAALGALAVYYVQGRFWTYHFIAAAGLSMILCFWQRRLALWSILLVSQAVHGPYRRWAKTPIPEGVSRVVVMSIDVPDAYPTVLGCGVTNETPWGSLGWIAGPWNTLHDPTKTPFERQKAADLLLRERERLRRSIIQKNVEVLVAVSPPNNPSFEYPFDYMEFLGPLPNFKKLRRVGKYELWSKGPLSEKLCTERF